MIHLSRIDVAHLFSLQEKGHLFEKILEGIYTHIVKPDDWVIDGGAHVGMHTVPLYMAT